MARYALGQELGIQQVLGVVAGPVHMVTGAGVPAAFFLDHPELPVSGDDQRPVSRGQGLGQDEPGRALRIVGPAELEVQRQSLGPQG